ncbi:MAG: class I SAM-dependent methyltransferase [Candidatus Heimdallarchaeota archaeon]|nr:class I SAM-dependent methyltransferase [Candidatus Heimdallarchaeota archaeon]
MATILMTLAEKKAPSRYDLVIDLLTLGKRRKIFQFIEKYIKEDFLVLDAGTGSGKVLDHIAHAWGTPIGVDINPEMLKNTKIRLKTERKHYELLMSSILELPFKNEAFNMIVCNFVLSELTVMQVANVLTEFLRCLRKTGVLLLTVENKPKNKISGFINKLIRAPSYIVARISTGISRHPIHDIENCYHDLKVQLIEKKEYLLGSLAVLVYEKK